MTLTPTEAAIVAYLLGSATGATGNLLSDGAKRVLPVLWSGFRDALSEARARLLPTARVGFDHNAAGFTAALVVEVVPRGADADAEKRVADLLRQFADPDVAMTMQTALLIAGRTRSHERHAMLAKVVTARLGSATDTARAAESKFAVEAIGRLGSEHLRVLGVMALVRYVGRLPVLDVPTDIAARHVPEREETLQPALDALRAHTRQEVTPFVERLSTWSAQHDVGRLATHSDALHLLSAGCVVLDSGGLWFQHAIAAPDPLTSTGADRLHSALQEWAASTVEEQLQAAPAGAQLVRVWGQSLSYLTPTPAGVLIGLAVHDAITGESHVRNREWAPEGEAPWFPGFHRRTR